MTELTPETQQICEILGTVSALLFIIAFIVAGLYLIYWCNQTDKLKKAYIKTLNEHDKAVIMDYKNTYYTFSKKHGKPQQDK